MSHGALTQYRFLQAVRRHVPRPPCYGHAVPVPEQKKQMTIRYRQKQSGCEENTSLVKKLHKSGVCLYRVPLRGSRNSLASIMLIFGEGE
jgi:hypothetical protein